MAPLILTNLSMYTFEVLNWDFVIVYCFLFRQKGVKRHWHATQVKIHCYVVAIRWKCGPPSWREVLGHDIDYSFLKLTLLKVTLYFELKMKSHKCLKVIVGIDTKNLFWLCQLSYSFSSYWPQTKIHNKLYITVPHDFSKSDSIHTL